MARCLPGEGLHADLTVLSGTRSNALRNAAIASSWVAAAASVARSGAQWCVRLPAVYAKGYTGQSIASTKRAKTKETPPVENRSRSDMGLPLGCCHIGRARRREGSVWKSKCTGQSPGWARVSD